MPDIAVQILNSAKKHGIALIELSPFERDQIRNLLLLKYAPHLSQWPTWIWEHFPDRETLISTDGWKLIAEYCPSAEVVLLFSVTDEVRVFCVPSGQDAVAILNDCYSFEVYYSDRDASYLLVHNHHDCVIACGLAKDWLQTRK